MVVKGAFAEAAASLHELLGIDVSVRSLEGMNRRMAADVEFFVNSSRHPPPWMKASCWSYSRMRPAYRCIVAVKKLQMVLLGLRAPSGFVVRRQLASRFVKN
jgi:hypothetical protein